MPNKELHLSGEGKTARTKPALIGERDVPRLAETTGRTRCATCGKWFHSRQQLSQHALVHSGVRKYKCRFCDRAFKQPSHLHQHHRIHTGEKPYTCSISGCNRAFPQLSNLNHHLRNHDKPEPPPENTCVFCDRAYASETVLRTHLEKIHGCSPESMSATRSTNYDSAKKGKPMCSINNNVTSQGIPEASSLHSYMLPSIRPTISPSAVNVDKNIASLSSGFESAVIIRTLYPKSVPAPKNFITNTGLYSSILNDIHNGKTLNNTCIDLTNNDYKNVDNSDSVPPLKKARFVVSNESVLPASGINIPNAYVSGIYIQPNAGNSIPTMNPSNINGTELNCSQENGMEFIEDISVMQYNYSLGDDTNDPYEQTDRQNGFATSHVNGTALNGHAIVGHTEVKQYGNTNYPTTELNEWTDGGTDGTLEGNVATAFRCRKRKASQPQRVVYATQE
ncbi:zinc finger protein 844-like isoform X2 [Mya arenaria]|nr:zinc finger protein 844-like isoform X2 [Mya arenaria]